MAITKVTLPTTLLVEYEDPEFGHKSLVLHSEEYYKDHGGEIRVKVKPMNQQEKLWGALDDKVYEGKMKPEIKFKWKDALDGMLEGSGKILAYQDEVQLNLNAKDKKEVMKHASGAWQLWYKNEGDRKWHKSSLSMKNEDALKSNGEKLKTQEGWAEITTAPVGEDPNKKTASVRLNEIADQLEKIAKPEVDGRVEAIADYLSNGLEHDGDDEALYFLQHEFGLRHEIAKKLLDAWKKKYLSGTVPLHMHLNKEVFPFIQSIIE